MDTGEIRVAIAAMRCLERSNSWAEFVSLIRSESRLVPEHLHGKALRKGAVWQAPAKRKSC